MSTSKKIDINKHRQEQFQKASDDWDNLTKDKDEWPAHEHEARFEALMRKALFAKPTR